MKTLMSALMISFSLAAGIAQAANFDAPASKTRTQVIAELQEAKALGLLSHGESDYPPALQASSSKTPQEVRAELDAARAAGTLSHGESDYPPASLDHSSKTRAEVLAELNAARQSGELSKFIAY